MNRNTVTVTFLSLCATVSAMDPNFMERFMFDRSNASCNFTGKLVLSNPMSIYRADKYYEISSAMQSAYELMVSHINSKRCGVEIGNDRFALALRTYGDKSSRKTIRAIADKIVEDPTSDFFLGGYKSSLTGVITPIAQKASKVIITGGASRNSVFEGKDMAFGVLDKAENRMVYELKYLVTKKGAKTIAIIWEENFSLGQSAEEKARDAGFTSIDIIQLTVNATTLEQVFDEFNRWNPDVVFLTVRTESNIVVWKAMYDAKFSPKAIVNYKLEDSIDPFYESYSIMRTSWIRSMPAIDSVTGWTADMFAENYMYYAFRNATYQAASASAVISILVQAIEAAQSTEQQQVAHQLNTRSFQTVFSNVTFDPNGQSTSSGWMLQIDKDGQPLIVGPLPNNTTDSLIYPIPTWGQRDCFRNGLCTIQNNTCLRNGLCKCKSLNQYSKGNGLSATCSDPLKEDYNYIPEQFITVGWILVSIQALLSVGAVIWMLLYRKNNLIRRSQPIFLILSNVGCLVMALSIIPMGIQKEYRYLQDEITGLPREEVNTQMHAADIACMTVPWLWSIGFSLAFSALFAKIFRINKVYENSRRCRRTTVLPKDVAFIVVIMVGLQLLLLTTWQLVSPLKWDRKILFINTEKSTKASQGRCTSEHGQVFFISMILSHIVCLFYAVYLCWIGKDVPSELSEARYISLSLFSMFEILLVGILVLFLSEYNPKNYYVIQVLIVFSQTFLVTVFIYVPKYWEMYRDKYLITRESSARSANHATITPSANHT